MKMMKFFASVSAASFAFLLTVGTPSFATYESDNDASAPVEQVSESEKPLVLDDMPLDITGDAKFAEERERLLKLLSPLSDSDGSSLWDSEQKVFTVQMTSDSALKEAKAILHQAETWLTVEYKLVKFSALELETLSSEVLDNQLETLGVEGMGGGVDFEQNHLMIWVPSTDPNASLFIEYVESLKDPRIFLDTSAPLDGGAESRKNDYTPWSGGAELQLPGGGYCTAGFNWKLWSSGKIVGSTARHCGTSGIVRNSGTYVGTLFSSNYATDSVLISGSTYAG